MGKQQYGALAYISGFAFVATIWFLVEVGSHDPSDSTWIVWAGGYVVFALIYLWAWEKVVRDDTDD